MVSTSTKRDERPYTTTMPSTLYTEVQKIAASEGRSMNKQIVQALKEMVDSRRRRQPAAA